MKQMIITQTVFLLSLVLTINITSAQSTKQDSVKTIITIGVFDGKETTVGNFEAEKVYKINEYCIALSDITKSQVDSLKGKRISVTGKLKIIIGKTHPAKTSTDGKIYEPYIEPDKKFITEPKFTILYNRKDPLLISE